MKAPNRFSGRMSTWMLMLVLAASFGLAVGCSGGDDPKDLVIYHLNDRHSHWLGFPSCDYGPSVSDGTEGGAARWFKFVEDARATEENLLLLDAGDFTQGTLFAAAENAAADLNTMQALGFDAAAVGNHELDWGPAGLAAMLQAANKPTIPLLAANMHFDPTDAGDDSLEALYGPEGESGKLIHPYIVRVMPNGLKVGIFGLLGLDAESTIPQAAPLSFSSGASDLAETAQQVVNTLRDDEGVDVVILLAHLGIENGADGYVGETDMLARNTTGIDIIASGHAHTLTPEPVSVPSEKGDWSTQFIEAGRYGDHLARWDVKAGGGEVKEAIGQVITIDDSLESSETLTPLLDGLVDSIEQDLLASYPLLPAAEAFLEGEICQKLCSSSCDLERLSSQANNLGNLVADAVRLAAGTDAAFISNGGDLRSSLQRDTSGGFSLADAFIVTPLGIGPEGSIGYPLVKLYLSWDQIKFVLEGTSADMGLSKNDYFLNVSGLKITMDTNQPTYTRIRIIEQYSALDETDTPVLIFDADNGGWQVDSTECISVTSSLYIASFSASMGIKIKDENCQELPPGGYLNGIIKNGQGQEVKLWYATAGFLASFGDGGVPTRYCSNPVRRIIDLANQ
ncbi:MAG: bifunctional metallophosphatase/5'-nucleotidase [Deltaproteobacteria bacterium]|nr:bifunctional metallophosphatase/5'-nucleotidase [Deltaproteobacteria bacterium]